MDQRDQLFNTEQTPEAFRFNESVAAVFPDMIQRSVPGYKFCLSQIEEITKKFVQPNSNVYDLGCSLGAITLTLRSGIMQSQLNDNIEIHAVDSSSAMIERAKNHVRAFSPSVSIHLHCQDILDFQIKNSSIVVLAYTLQFISPKKRSALLKNIYDGLVPNGAFILIDKVHEEDNMMEDISTNLHHEFKRNNGYSDLEISKKRQALENVLITESIREHEHRLKSVGFSHYFLLSKHYGFCFWLCVKK